MTDVRLIAFYLPQFHPIPENDAWWGKGFTEWTNVVKARPLFLGHDQPHLPTDLGFYDLRLPEAREAQASLAREHGVHGFCYYHYWFNGRRLLGRPLDDVLASGRPDFPFCLCWANENWTRAWDGQEQEVLIGQEYSDEDDRQHMVWLAKVLSDERYIRVDGRPLLLVYRASSLPDPRRTAETWRAEARRMGIGEIFLCKVESFDSECGDPAAVGFDAAVAFQPVWWSLGERLTKPDRRGIFRRPDPASQVLAAHRVHDYRILPERVLAEGDPGYLRFPCVTPGWDNSARRRQDARILLHSSPAAYGAWLAGTVRQAAVRPSESRLVFVNAWNEWAEGCHLEPCQRWGRAYLEATREALA